MNLTHLEKEVKKQSLNLEQEIPKLLEVPSLKDKFVAYLNGDMVFGNTHEKCFLEADKKFGSKSGFAIDEISEKKLLVSALVKF